MNKEKFFKLYVLFHILITMISGGLGFHGYVFFLIFTIIRIIIGYKLDYLILQMYTSKKVKANSFESIVVDFMMILGGFFGVLNEFLN